VSAHGSGGAPEGLGADGGGEVLAAVDCGTNSTRLLVAERPGDARCRLMRITRLGEGVDRTGMLAPAAIERTLAVLEEFREVMDREGAGHVRAAATSAVRDAANGEAFLEAARAVLGVRPELLTGEEEGRLSYAGATAELADRAGPYLVVDVGGGSTELVVGSVPGIPEAAVSVDVGCVRVTERYLRHDPPTRAELEHARLAVRDALERGGLAPPPGATVVGLAGTVSTLAAMVQGLERYDRQAVHHFVLRKDAIDDLLGVLAAEPRAARLARPGLEPGRADVIVGGALVVSAVLEFAGAERLLVSEADILDGLVRSLVRPGRTDR
jgi:exopolyphosphatase/guanosine-5'-triphosphate,3'-diphosphate pyrophosphatase